MFCTECGQAIGDEAKFCAYCGTRRAVPPVADAATSAPSPRQEPPSVAPPAPARTIRSTAEIMPIRMQRTVPPPPVTDVSGEELEHAESVVPWPEEESNAPPMYAPPEPPVQRERAPVRPAAPPPLVAEAPAPERYVSVPFAASPSSPEVTGERRKISPVLIGAIIVALIALGGIGWMLRTSMTPGSKAAANVGITIYPTEAKVVEGKSVDFAATITGAPTSDVTWKVEEGDSAGDIRTRGAYSKEGEISLYSTYTAPKTPGTYHLVATSTADTTKSATAEITVTAK
jgi:zinc-ribbon domain/Immunoglobulin I-set domain